MFFKRNRKKIILTLVFLMLSLISFGVLANGKYVVHHTAAFPGELELLKNKMSKTYGEAEVLAGDFGRKYYIWEPGPRTRLIGSITRIGMENAVLSSSLILNLPEKYQPDLVTHGGICGNIWGEGKIMDIYAPYAAAFPTKATYGAEGPKPATMNTYQPDNKKIKGKMWFTTDPVLTKIIASGYEKAIKDTDFQKIWAESGLEYSPTLHKGYVQVSSNYFVSNDKLNLEWSKKYKITPTDKDKIMGEYDGKVHKVGGLDMETAAVVWTFKQANIPVAVLRYPSDTGRDNAHVEIDNFGETASAVGGYTFYHGLNNLIKKLELSELKINNGQLEYKN